MDHRQDYPERDELRAKFTRWLETIIKRAKIDYLRKYENRPERIYQRQNFLIWRSASHGQKSQGCSPLMILRRNG